MEVLLDQRHHLNIAQLQESTIIAANFRQIERWGNTLPIPPFTYLTQPAAGDIFQFDGTSWSNVTPVTALGSYIPYTPTLSNFTLGNGIVNAYYKQTAVDMVHTRGWVKLGSTSSFSANVTISPPAGFTYLPAEFMVGSLALRDDSTANRSTGSSIFNTAALPDGTGGTILPHVNSQGLNATTPITWATNDSFYWSIFLQLDS